MSLINDTKERTLVSFADNKSYTNMYGYLINDVQFHFKLPSTLVYNGQNLNSQLDLKRYFYTAEIILEF